MNAALAAADPTRIIRKNLKLTGSILHVDRLQYPLKDYRRILVIGGGKASGYMAEEVEKLLGKWITGGLVIIPDYLRPMPRGTSLLLKSGAGIEEINTVRKHLSQIKGGRIAARLYPATVLTLIISDVVGDKIDAIASGPTAPDPTTYRDAEQVLKKYDLWSQIPTNARRVITEGLSGSIPDTPKKESKAFKHVHNLIIGNGRASCLAAAAAMTKAGYRTQVLSIQITGEAREAGRIFGSIARDIRDNSLPFAPPTALVAGGETTVTVRGKGKGGRNQELVLAAAVKISGSDAVVVGSFATDGIEGQTHAAGALADGTTVMRGLKVGMDPEDYLGNNDSYHYFSKLKDLVITGPTGTNVNDITILAANGR